MVELSKDSFVILMHINNNRDKTHSLISLTKELQIPTDEVMLALKPLVVSRYLEQVPPMPYYKITNDGERKLNKAVKEQEESPERNFVNAQVRLVQLQIDELVKRPNRRRWDAIVAAGIALIAALVGAAAGARLQKDQVLPQETKNDIPTVLLVRDTVRIPTPKDTLLMRIVK